MRAALFRLTAPCADCPFLKVGGIRLTRGRVVEIANSFTNPQGAIFHCHRTVESDEDADDEGYINSFNDGALCIGGVLFADKQGRANQMVRIGERLRLLKTNELRGRALVFDSLRQMLKTAWR